MNFRHIPQIGIIINTDYILCVEYTPRGDDSWSSLRSASNGVKESKIEVYFTIGDSMVWRGEDADKVWAFLKINIEILTQPYALAGKN